MKTNESALINSAKAVWTRETKYTFSRHNTCSGGRNMTYLVKGKKRIKTEYPFVHLQT